MSLRSYRTRLPDDGNVKVSTSQMSLNIHLGVRLATLHRVAANPGGRQASVLIGRLLAPVDLLEPKRLINDEGLVGVSMYCVQLVAKTKHASARCVYAAHSFTNMLPISARLSSCAQSLRQQRIDSLLLLRARPGIAS